MSGPNRTPSQWQRPDGWKYGIDPRVPRWDATGEAVELPDVEDPPRSGGVIAWLAVALIVAAIVIGFLVTRP